MKQERALWQPKAVHKVCDILPLPRYKVGSYFPPLFWGRTMLLDLDSDL